MTYCTDFLDDTVLITGGTGSFGNAMVKRLLETYVRQIRIFSRDELKQDDMRKRFNDNEKLRFFIGDIRNPDSLREAMRGTTCVFSAAALKQIPSCEAFPLEAIQTNILGSNNVMNMAIEYGVNKVVMLSTDKAVQPVNVMGMTKALMEKTMLAKANTAFDHKVMLCATRYGNVMSSRGSVIPLFVEQIKAGKKLTITDPNMTRFMLPLNIAVDLVLYAFSFGRPGSIFVHKAPAATIGDLAQVMLDIFNSSVGSEIVGARPGEKIHETLLTVEELRKAHFLGEYIRVDTHEGTEGQDTTQDYTSENTHRLSQQELYDIVMNLDYIKQERLN
jgi:UDP-glucose 4-epimerase